MKYCEPKDKHELVLLQYVDHRRQKGKRFAQMEEHYQSRLLRNTLEAWRVWKQNYENSKTHRLQYANKIVTIR